MSQIIIMATIIIYLAAVSSSAAAVLPLTLGLPLSIKTFMGCFPSFQTYLPQPQSAGFPAASFLSFIVPAKAEKLNCFLAAGLVNFASKKFSDAFPLRGYPIAEAARQTISEKSSGKCISKTGDLHVRS